MRARVKLHYHPDSGWYVDLPSYQMVPGSWQPVLPGKSHADGVLPGADPADPALRALSVEVIFPDEDGDPERQRPDAGKIRSRYRDHPRWGDRNKPPDV